MTTRIISIMQADTPTTTNDEPPKKKRRETSNKPRAPARPYRRLDKTILDARIKDLNKKLTVLRSKVVLLEDRLEGHDSEFDLRTSEIAAA